MYTIWSDGSSTGKQGAGGAVAIVLSDDWPEYAIITASHRSKDVGNNGMEMLGIWLGLTEVVPNSLVQIYTDNKGMRCWIEEGNWQANVPFIKKMVERIRSFRDLLPAKLVFNHIPGHSGFIYNEAADHYAKIAKTSQISFRKVVKRKDIEDGNLPIISEENIF